MDTPIRDRHIEEITRHLEVKGGYRCPMCQQTQWTFVGYQRLPLADDDAGASQQETVIHIACNHCAAMTTYRTQ